MKTNDKLNILQRIQKIYSHDKIKNCPKAGSLKDYNGKEQYKYFKAEDVVLACSLAMQEHGVIFTINPSTLKLDHSCYTKKTAKGEKDVHYFIIQGEAMFINVDDKTDFISIPFYGSAEDDSDKAIGKANTYAKKIALMNMFLMQDGEDTDSSISEEGKKIKKQSELFLELKVKLENCDNKEFLEILKLQLSEHKKDLSPVEINELGGIFKKKQAELL